MRNRKPSSRLNLLFICSRNQWRSPTAEAIFNTTPHRARSAGTAASARIRASRQHLEWADLVFVMEYKHRDQLILLFGAVARDRHIIVLDIPDEYGYMDEELISMLQQSVAPHLTTESDD